MSWAAVEDTRRILQREQGAVVKGWGGKLPIALLYPNTYYVGMSSLALQTLYGMLNARPDVVCERAFCGFRRFEPDEIPLSLETQRQLTEFSVLATSFSFELDYLNFVSLLRRAGIPPLAAERDESYPFLLAGGPAVTANPEPLADLCDAFVIGESDEVLPRLVDALRAGIPGLRQELLQALARIPGIYAPLYPASSVQRQWVRALDPFPTHTAVYSHATEFGDMGLIEIARGCKHACRFCLAGCLYRPQRERSVPAILEQARRAREQRQKVGLVSAAVSDYSHIDALLDGLQELGLQVSVSSLRAAPLPESLLRALAASHARTLTIAPEAGSERLRAAIHKRIRREDILEAARRAAEHRFPELKLYFMLGLPGEEDEDVQASVDLVREVTQAFNGRVLASVAAFVPKSHTAFEREAMAPQDVLRRRMRALQGGLRPLKVRLATDSLPWASVQAVLARGDRRLGPVLASLDAPALADWHHALQQHGLSSADFTRARAPSEPLPWSFIHAAPTPPQ